MSNRIPEIEVLNSSFGNLTAMKEVSPYTWISKNGKLRSKRMFLCECVCGKSLEVSLEHLRSGHTQSCGCYQKHLASESNVTHGKYKGAGNTHRYHNIWRGMIKRCNDTDNYKYLTHSPDFINNPAYFYAYIENTLGDCPEGHSLDRIDTNIGYVEGNLRWADAHTQAKNTRSWKDVSSKYKGVCFYKNNNKWGANIRRLGIHEYLGLFDNERDAAEAYVRRHLELEGMDLTQENINYFIEYFSHKGKCETDHD